MRATHLPRALARAAAASSETARWKLINAGVYDTTMECLGGRAWLADTAALIGSPSRAALQQGGHFVDTAWANWYSADVAMLINR